MRSRHAAMRVGARGGSSAPARSFVLGALALAAGAACNALLDNGPAALHGTDAGSASSSSGDLGGSSSGSTGSSGSTVDAATSDASSSGAVPVPCPCGESTTGDCSVCPPVAASGLPHTPTLIAAGTFLWAAVRTDDQTALFEHDIDGEGNVVPGGKLLEVPSIDALASVVPPLGADAAPRVFVLEGGAVRLCLGTLCPSIRGGVTQLESAAAGVLLATIGPALQLQIHHSNETGEEIVDLPFPPMSQSSTIALTASRNVAYAALGAPSVQRSHYPTTQPELPDIPTDTKPVTVAANDQELFVSPCTSARGGICASTIDADAPPSSTSRVVYQLTRPIANGSPPPVTDLHVDGNVLYFNLQGQAHYCATNACTPTPVGTGTLQSFTRNRKFVFTLVGGSLFRAQRSPLRVTP